MFLLKANSMPKVVNNYVNPLEKNSRKMIATIFADEIVNIDTTLG